MVQNARQPTNGNTQQLHLLTENVREVVWMCSPDLRTLHFISPAADELLGQPLARIYSRPECLIDCIHPDDRPSIVAKMDALGSSQSTVEFSQAYRILRPDGSMCWVWARFHPILDKENRVTQLVGIASDIFERKADQLELQELQTKLVETVTEQADVLAQANARLLGELERAEQMQESLRLQAEILEQTHDAIIAADRNGRVIFWNKAAERDTGYRYEEMRGQPVEIVATTETRDQFRAQFAASFERGCHLAAESRWRRKDGSTYEADVSTDVLRNSAGRAIGIVVSILDITQRKQAQSESARRQDELTHLQRVAILNKLTTGLAHEINQPLMAIASYAETLKYIDPSDGSPQAWIELVNHISIQSHRAGDIVRRLRDLVRKCPVRPESVVIDELVANVLPLVSPKARLAEIHIQHLPNVDLPSVVADRIQLQQVLMNLILNAIEALRDSPAGRPRSILIQSEQRDTNHIGILVADNGPGIAADVANRVFEPFFSGKPHGLGMGLPICRSIMSAHRGSLFHKPTPGGGATFCLTLPAS